MGQIDDLEQEARKFARACVNATTAALERLEETVTFLHHCLEMRKAHCSNSHH